VPADREDDGETGDGEDEDGADGDLRESRAAGQDRTGYSRS
jgi:hypothetical protein